MKFSVSSLESFFTRFHHVHIRPRATRADFNSRATPGKMHRASPQPEEMAVPATGRGVKRDICRSELSSIPSARGEGVFQQLVACVTHLRQLVFGNMLFAASGNGAPCKGTLGWALRLTHLF